MITDTDRGTWTHTCAERRRERPAALSLMAIPHHTGVLATRRQFRSVCVARRGCGTRGQRAQASKCVSRLCVGFSRLIEGVRQFKRLSGCHAVPRAACPPVRCAAARSGAAGPPRPRRCAARCTGGQAARGTNEPAVEPAGEVFLQRGTQRDALRTGHRRLTERNSPVAERQGRMPFS